MKSQPNVLDRDGGPEVIHWVHSFYGSMTGTLVATVSAWPYSGSCMRYNLRQIPDIGNGLRGLCPPARFAGGADERAEARPRSQSGASTGREGYTVTLTRA